MSDMEGVIPIPEATATTFSLSMAGELKGERNGPMTNAGLCMGVSISLMRDSVQSPHLLMQMEDVSGLFPGKTVKAWNWYRLIQGS